MKLEINNKWILYFFLAVVITSAGDVIFIPAMKCAVPLGKWTIYIARNISELLAGVMGMAVGYWYAMKKMKKEGAK